MSRVFENPANNYRESIGISDSILVLFFGVIYLAIKGLWPHVFIWIVLIGLPSIAGSAPAGILLAILASTFYAFIIQELLARKYLARGWRDVTNKSQKASGSVDHSAEIGIKFCQFCGEKIKVEAVKCKHCGSQLV